MLKMVQERADLALKLATIATQNAIENSSATVATESLTIVRLSRISQPKLCSVPRDLGLLREKSLPRSLHCFELVLLCYVPASSSDRVQPL